MNAPARTFGKYLLDEEIARGGMSRVFSARLRGLGGFEKKLVVKQVLPELARDPRFVAMFVEEAKTLVQMSHPHIAPVFELGVVDGVYFLAMEYVEGATLASIVRDGPLAPGLVAHLGAEVCDALHYAHSRFGVVHRDVTPRNVIVDGAGHSRLLDFGIAAPLDASDEAASEAVFGTPGYLSPEQLEGRAIGPASDVFALGAVLFEALTGRRAFDARTVDETRAALAADGPALDDDAVPHELGAVIVRALERDPSARYASARELGRALRGWLASAHPEGVAPELGLRAERAEREERRRLSLEPAPVEASEGTREVRTLATSKALDALLEPSTAEPGDDARDRDEQAAPGTVRIERASGPDAPPTSSDASAAPPREVPPASSDASAEPLREALRAPAASDASTHVAREAPPEPTRASTPPTRAALLPWGIAAVALLALAALLVRPWLASEQAPRIEPPVDSSRTEPSIEPTIERVASRAIEPEDDAAPVEPEAAPRPIEAPPPVEPQEALPVAALPAPPEAPLRVDPAPRTTTLSVNASPWADVRLDGRAIGRTPQRRIVVRTGRHAIELSCPPLGRHVSHTFEAHADRPLTLVADLTQEPPVVRVR